jgi:hypothetical protein
MEHSTDFQFIVVCIQKGSCPPAWLAMYKIHHKIIFRWNHSTPFHIEMSWNRGTTLKSTVFVLAEPILPLLSLRRTCFCQPYYVLSCFPWHFLWRRHQFPLRKEAGVFRKEACIDSVFCSIIEISEFRDKLLLRMGALIKISFLVAVNSLSFVNKFRHEVSPLKVTSFDPKSHAM